MGDAMVGRDGLIGCYMMTNRMHGAIYIGVSSQLVSRVAQHREGVIDGFTKRYGLKRLVWYEFHDTITGAIQREKSLKRWPRDWKANLIERTNPDWADLFDGLARNGVETPSDPETYRDWPPEEE
ncbi:GIY-YIG nuclease family protein [Brevundimonas albigilva]|uniref:GIY-YIG nuclease family protein n=2 Tax=Brevundimonas TaxID=41275 RepID=A0ABY4SP46_9CAUL|nr:GIY-YIG nuclease family protein [Brevundimonas albigilva]URI16018.1 GIY-YIG nuclease family protein [Brevundimonas albigilva]